MKVAILCGGRGTRIRDVSETIPKPMMPVGNRPILWHIMKIYGHFGFNEFILLLGYRGEVIRDFFLNFAAYMTDVTVDLAQQGEKRLIYHGQSAEPWKVTLVDTGDDVMTGARLWRARRHFQNDPFFLATYGDGVGDVNIGQMVDFHRSHGKTATLAGVQPPGRFGELVVDGQTVRAFNEKPQVSGGHINGGFFIFNRSIFDQYLGDGDHLMLENEPLKKMARDGQLQMYYHSGFWQPMDTPREFQLLNELWRAGKAPWKIW